MYGLDTISVTKHVRGLESDNRLRHFVAARVFYHKFDRLPAKYDSVQLQLCRY